MRCILIIILFSFGINILSAQVDSIYLDLEGQVENLNNQSNFESSLRLIDSFEKVHTSVEAKFYTNLFRSYVYKRVFDYKMNDLFLNKARQFGKQSPDSIFYNQIILAQKSMASFDTKNYELATKYMDSIRVNGISILSLEDQGKILMQEAYIIFLNGNNSLAIDLLNRSLLLMDKSTPQHKPMVYGKLLEVYGSDEKIEMVNQIATKALSNAKEYGIVKYEIYIHSVLAETYQGLGYIEKSHYSLKRKSELEGLYSEKGNQLRHYLHEKSDSLFKVSKENSMNVKVISALSIGLILVLIMFFIRSRKSKILRQNDLSDVILETHEDEIPQVNITPNIKGEEIIEDSSQPIEVNDDSNVIEDSEASSEENQKEDVLSPITRQLLLEKGLSHRQIEILRYFIQGDSKKIIASKLIISENTVKYHIKCIYAKLAVTNRSELVEYIVK